MNILLVEDDERKRRQVADVLTAAATGAHVEEARSLRSALRQLEGSKWDLVILDMSIPTFDISRDEQGGRTQSLGGRDLLRHMRRLRVDSPVVVLTQYDQVGEGETAMDLNQLNHLLRAEHGASYL